MKPESTEQQNEESLHKLERHMEEMVKKTEQHIEKQMETTQNLMLGCFEGQRKRLGTLSEDLQENNSMLTIQEIYSRCFDLTEEMSNRILDTQKGWTRINLSYLYLSVDKMPEAVKQWATQIEDAAERMIDAERQIYATWSEIVKAINSFNAMDILFQGNGNGPQLFETWSDAGEKLLQVESDLMTSIGSGAQQASRGLSRAAAESEKRAA